MKIKLKKNFKNVTSQAIINRLNSKALKVALPDVYSQYCRG